MSSGPIVYSFVGAGGAARELPVPSPSAAAATAAPAHRVHIAAPPRDPFATDSWVRLPNRTTTIGVEPRWVPLGESPIRRRRFPVAAGRALPEIRRGRANDETLTASLTARSAPEQYRSRAGRSSDRLRPGKGERMDFGIFTEQIRRGR